MGKVASSLGYKVTRPLREFNLEQRVTRELKKEKRPTAPRHQTTAALFEEAVRDQPEEVKSSLREKDTDLHQRLKSVYVTSQDVTVPVNPVNPDRPLPMDRSVTMDPEFGFIEPKSVPYGKVTLRRAVEAISRHQEDPVLWTARRLAIEHKLSIELTEQMLKHFQTFILVVPPNPKAKLASDSLSRTPLTAPHHSVRQLPEGEADQDSKGNKKKS
ncbi:NADH dehydrogenase [ubiquinone] 1 alpha subcomplex assembly factor 4-like [Portunus trituberculatus]|uniref:NADH dehydrogenase [ubiquinone] 1 alpha subcomplex assembly factor 4-like n=1 Tax=Portunus trituberculatus TaxID=210409 RepID=UPI001E1CE043|nr:NADH dehydrogenase [ubiquinone] 1 alpha subcomplex assembly factor 4-like [Portunus trituberculatus]XP_045133577.1 NADH dehydrogenase [ubiquinone] 1 alpha subcomplex assembly factor 4-like [Portunus trituberculatus]